VAISARRRRLFSTSCVVFCLWIRGDQVESPSPKSKSALSATSAGTLFLAKLSSNYLTTVPQFTVKDEKKILASVGGVFGVV
jgi:hypothetical protein